ncbi:MAG TPA: phosphoenolpyruvate synthase [Gammaproteobacteria bacterium]|nr:phosphoenolpyruvate synthase [Gammaproteobacteria bacterium]
MNEYILSLDSIGMDDVTRVGGKNASLGEMIQHLAASGVNVPGGFATTAEAYRRFMADAGLTDKISAALEKLDAEDVRSLAQTGKTIRQWIIDSQIGDELRDAIARAFEAMEREAGGSLAVAVRSSATAEDLPGASFAGQQETFLNVRGLDNVLLAVKTVFASLFNDRAISYRVHHGFDHDEVALSAGIQRMVRSDLAASGVMFTLDTESGFKDVVFITSSYGLGEAVVQGTVNPDEFYVHKPTLAAGRTAILQRTLGSKHIKMVYSNDTGLGETVRTVDIPEAERARFTLTDKEVEHLARQAVIIEQHYRQPMDIEWAKDGETGELFILQARPETVKSKSHQVVERYIMRERGEVLVEGRSVGQRIASGKVRLGIDLEDMDKLQKGDVLVTDMTDPDWEPIMKRAAAIVTDRGGRTCHAAIIARELGIPAVVGCGDATRRLSDGQHVTVSCAEGDTGFIYKGQLDFKVHKHELNDMPRLPLKVMLNVGNPGRAFTFASVPNAGVGLARLEFIINNTIGVHPKACLEFEQLPSEVRRKIQSRCAGYPDPVSFYVGKLTEGIATLAAAFAPHPVIVRLSDFKSNEYAHLVAGSRYEPKEENPMIGWRGASRYISESFRDCFELECRALRRVRDEMGFTNVQIMVPFVRTLEEASQVTDLLAHNGLQRGVDGLKVIMMCEIPSNVVLAEQFLEYFDGFSIGSNDLTQMTLALDRDSGLVSTGFDERNPAVKSLIHQVIGACRKAGKYVGICGQGPSDYPDFARWLLQEGIGSVSLNPDSVVETWLFMAEQTGEFIAED